MEPIKEERRGKSEVDKILNAEKPLGGMELYSQFVNKTKIEENKEEDNVLRMFIHGMTKTDIVEELNKKYKKEEVNFTSGDLDRFLSRNTQIIKYFEDDKTKLVRRHLEARAGVDELMKDLLIFTQQHLNKANDEGDTRTINDTIRTLVDVLNNYSKLQGWVQPQAIQAVQVNVADEVANRKGNLIRKIVEADFTVEDENKNKLSENEEADL